LDLETKANSVVIYFRIIDLSLFLRRVNQAEIFIKKSLIIVKEIEPFLSQLSTISKDAILNLKNRIIDFSKSIHKPIKNDNKKLNRNDKIEVVYQNGQRKQGKYKDLEQDIRKGLCIIDNIITPYKS
ncbi:MAG: hypothetical protein MUE81_24265, partial [Thermoflexibacter sp.]|nr:hypothetical protein [Thermoflexibacter sp.]